MLQIPNEKLRELLVGAGVIKSEDFDLALKDAERMEQSVSDILITRNLLTENYLLDAVAEFYNIVRIATLFLYRLFFLRGHENKNFTNPLALRICYSCFFGGSNCSSGRAFSRI